MLEPFKSLFKSSERMGAAAITVLGPLPSISYCYDIERAAKRLGLGGWIKFVNQTNIEMEVYGTYAAVGRLLEQFKDGSLLSFRPLLETMWLPYNDKHPTFVLQLFDLPVRTSR